MNKKYTEQEKQSSVARYSRGESATSISQNTGIARSTLYRWINDYRLSAENEGSIITRTEAIRLRMHLEKQGSIIKVLKTVDCTVSSPLHVKLDAMEQLYDQYSVYVLCEAMDVARGTFYNHILRNKRGNSSYAKSREEKRILIRRVFDDSHQVFGARKIRAVLLNQGYHISEKLTAELMQEMGLYSIRTTAKKDYEKQWAKKENRNVLQRQFHVDRPNKTWVSDITCIKHNDTYFYVCAVIDLFSRSIIACKISKKNSTQLTASTFKEAYQKRLPGDELIFHSDRGTQYTSHSFSKLLKSCRVVQSLSAPGKPHDNAVMESFFSSLKQESLYRKDYRSEAKLKDGVAAYVHFYNHERPHSALNYKTPVQFESSFFERDASA